MKTRIRGSVFIVLALFFGLVCLLSGVFWWNGREEVGLELSEEYFLLVRDCAEETSAVVAGQVYFSGGAGYLTEEGVVVACYFSERDAQFIKSGMDGKGVETRICRRAPGRVVLRGDAAAAAESVRANAGTADSCARILFDAANGLERTDVSQETARAAVEGVASALAGLCAENGGRIFERWNARLASAARRGREIASGILFAKDLRYLQVELCLAVAEIAEYFC